MVNEVIELYAENDPNFGKYARRIKRMSKGSVDDPFSITDLQNPLLKKVIKQGGLERRVFHSILPGNIQKELTGKQILQIK